ncbi:MAG TPA: MFS transporter [Bryobacteraceae bacterium]|nr:MFS transporter [Bryobacteraceae bacterium]
MQIPHLRWWIAALLFLSTVINYIDRQTLSVLSPVLTRELQLSPVGYSNVLTAFLAAYTVMYVGSGFLVDRWGTRLSLSVFMVWWSAANMLHAFAQGVWSLGILRFLLGMGESGNFMAAFKAVSEWYPAKERALIHGLINGGAAIGAVIAPPAITWIHAHYGWQPAFLATGSLGFVWLAFWLAIYYPPDRHPRITEAERAYVMADAAVTEGSRPQTTWRELLRYRQTWGLLLARFFSDPVWWFYLFWLPKYLVEQRGFTMAEMGMMAWMPYLAADAGALCGGWLSGRLVGRGFTPLRARFAIMLPFAFTMPLSIAVNHAPTRTLTLALICVVTFSHMAWKTNQATLTNDVFPKPLIGTVSGILAFGNGLGGTLFTWMTGYVVQWFGYEAIFLLMSVLHPLSYVLVRRLVREPVTE